MMPEAAPGFSLILGGNVMRSLAVLILSGLIAAGGDSFPSGPQVGDKLPGLKVKAFSGPDAGKEVQPVDQAKGGPTLLIFVHRITRPGLKTLRPIDEFASQHGKLNAHIVWLTEDRDKAEEYLKRAEKSLNLQVPIGICLDGKDGPLAYGLNDKVTLTVLVADKNKVVANFALTDPNERDAPKVIESLKKVLPKD
jgi:hypothetical protein